MFEVAQQSIKQTDCNTLCKWTAALPKVTSVMTQFEINIILTVYETISNLFKWIKIIKRYNNHTSFVNQVYLSINCKDSLGPTDKQIWCIPIKHWTSERHAARVYIGSVGPRPIPDIYTMLNKLGSQFERPTMTQPGCQYDTELSKFELFGRHVDNFLFTNINMIDMNTDYL